MKQKSENANKNCENCGKNSNATRENPIETVVERESQILPAGTPKSKKTSAEGNVTDPPVPNRAHTEMKNAKNQNKVP